VTTWPTKAIVSSLIAVPCEAALVLAAVDPMVALFWSMMLAGHASIAISGAFGFTEEP
jgi:hypothetical protein